MVGVAREGGVDVLQDWVGLVARLPSRGSGETRFHGESDNILTAFANGVECGAKMAID